MSIPAHYPYRSEAARDRCFAYFDGLAARWPVFAENRTIPTAFGPTFVRISGDPAAKPLVLLHGAAATSLMWAPNVKSLSAARRMIAVDQIGEFGRSLCSRPPGSFDDLTSWLDELFDGLQLSAVDLAGVSYGGALAARYAARFPARIAKLVLLAPAATVLRPSAQFWVRLIFAAVSWRRGLPSFVRWMFDDMTRRDPAWVEHVVAELSLNFESLVRRRPPVPSVWTDAQWRALQVPTLVLMGERDVQYSASRAARRLKRIAPHIAMEIVPGAGHDFTIAHAELINQRIVEFLDAGVTA